MKVFKVFLSVVFAIMFATIFSVAQASDVATKKSQRQVMHDFMQTLDKSTTKDWQVALNEAINKSSNGKFQTLDSVVQSFWNDYKNTIKPDSEGNISDESAKEFLLKYCGINLDNDDVGAIIGKDAGESSFDITAESIIPENTDDIIYLNKLWYEDPFLFSKLKQFNDIFPTRLPLPRLTFRKRGLDVIIARYETLEKKDYVVINGLYNWWIDGALDLIEKSYGIKFSNDEPHQIVYANSFQLGYIMYDSKFNENKNTLACAGRDSGNTLVLWINREKIDDNVDLSKNPNGKIENFLMDRNIAHELTHAIMAAKIPSFSATQYPFVAEGLAELTIGADDTRDLVGLLKKHERFSNSFYNPSKDNDDVYCTGYMFFRYFAKQVADASNGVPSISTNKTEMLRKLVGVYKGSYFATQGETGLTLTVYEENNQFKALFDFYNLPGRTNAKSGKYYMNVSYDKISGNYKLDAYQWLEQPSGWEFINLNGKLDKNILSGDSSDSRGSHWRFNVTRVNEVPDISTNETEMLKKLVGVYKGSYFAGQDEVGTTLTIFEDIDGTFKAVWDFYNLSNKTNFYEGNTRCHVKYDVKTRMYSVQSYEWIDRKLNYPFLTLSGRLNGNIFSGDHQYKFSVVRVN